LKKHAQDKYVLIETNQAYHRQPPWILVLSKRIIRRAVKMTGQWLRFHRHDPIESQHRTLRQKLNGHFGYYGITGNGEALNRFRYAVARLWGKWLQRRKRCGFISRDRFLRLLERYPLPTAVVVHSVYRRASQSVT
jgi:hypothetical protein